MLHRDSANIEDGLELDWVEFYTVRSADTLWITNKCRRENFTGWLVFLFPHRSPLSCLLPPIVSSSHALVLNKRRGEKSCPVVNVRFFCYFWKSPLKWLLFGDFYIHIPGRVLKLFSINQEILIVWDPHNSKCHDGLRSLVSGPVSDILCV